MGCNGGFNVRPAFSANVWEPVSLAGQLLDLIGWQLRQELREQGLNIGRLLVCEGVHFCFKHQRMPMYEASFFWQVSSPASVPVSPN